MRKQAALERSQPNSPWREMTFEGELSQGEAHLFVSFSWRPPLSVLVPSLVYLEITVWGLEHQIPLKRLESLPIFLPPLEIFEHFLQPLLHSSMVSFPSLLAFFLIFLTTGLVILWIEAFLKNKKKVNWPKLKVLQGGLELNNDSKLEYCRLSAKITLDSV